MHITDLHGALTLNVHTRKREVVLEGVVCRAGIQCKTAGNAVPFDDH